MDQWSEVMKPPPVRINCCRDVYEMLAYKMVCPVLQYVWKDAITMEAQRVYLADGTPCTDDLMTSPHMINTQEAIRARPGNADAICVPLIVYADGVALGVRNKVKATAVMCTFGIFSDELLKRDISKVSLGYINDLSDESKELLSRHLCTHTAMSNDKAKKETTG
jgi:hypothetical protein